MARSRTRTSSRRRTTSITVGLASLLTFLVSCTWRTTAIAPLALHQVISVSPGGEAVIRLSGYDLDGDDLVATISSLPESGTLHQLSKVYSEYGYDPAAGEVIAGGGGIEVTGSGNRVVYKRPAADAEPTGRWGSFTYTVSDGSDSAKAGTVYLVSGRGLLEAAEFDFGVGTWKVCQRGGSYCETARHDPSSRGLLSFFLSGSDTIVHSDADGVDDTLWWFKAGSAFSGNLGVAYAGTLEFSIGSFSGTFSEENLNGDALRLVELYCSACARNTGTTLAFPLSVAGGFAGGGTGVSFSIPLSETGGWLKDPENTLKQAAPPTKCEMAEVLSNLSELRILGDFTKRHESVALDSVYIRAAGSGTSSGSGGLSGGIGGSSLPVCAQGSPDATVCSC
ncbi:unnamed protein product [Ectocarpus sp. 4 AP-2014]